MKVANESLIRAISYELNRLGDDADLNHLDVSDVTDFRRAFYNRRFVGDISKWDMSNARNTSEMFSHAAVQVDISNWDVSSVVIAKSMF